MPTRFSRPVPPAIDEDTWRRHRLANGVQSLLLLTVLATILGTLGWVLSGPAGVLMALASGALLVLFNPGMSARLTLRMYGARPLDRREAPDLVRVLEQLAARAGLPQAPALYHVPSSMLNAFAVGSREHAAIAVTDGLLRTMTPREVVGVLAHEMAHVCHNDMWVMGLADFMSRLTSTLSTVGQMLLLINLPLLMMSDYTISWTAIAILIFAPTLAALVQLALSRTREFDADLGAARLTGDPRGLASALEKMERYQGRLFEQILLPGKYLPDPSLLRTHPSTQERVRRLLELEGQPPTGAPPRLDTSLGADQLARARPVVERAPRRRLGGVWY